MRYKGQIYTFQRGVRLGGGGMADVYLGQAVGKPSLDVALKVPRADLPPDIDAEMFLREAAAAAQVQHANVVSVVDWGQHPPFIAFEFIEGETLDRVIARRRSSGDPIEFAQLCEWSSQLLEGLEAINQHLVHRDVKPANIFDADGRLKISDFGLAKYVGEATRPKTFKGWGSAPYMAPEVFRGDSVDWHADQYALGIAIFELATLSLPFEGGDLEAKHLFERPRRLTQDRNDLPEALATAIGKMLEKRPDDRFGSWGEVKNAFATLSSPARLGPAAESVVRAAVQGLEEVRAADLAARTAAENLAEQRKERQALLTYWADRLFGELQGRIDQVNQGIGESAIQYSRTDPSPVGLRSPTLTASFLNARLEIRLEALPPDASATDLHLWGVIRLSSNRRAWYGNLGLTPNPAPYGTWWQIDLEMNPIVGQDARPEMEDHGRGRYEILGGSRLVVANNWEALVFQRGMRNVVSLVQYREQPLDLPALISELLEIMTSDGAALPVDRSRMRDDW